MVVLKYGKKKIRCFSFYPTHPSPVKSQGCFKKKIKIQFIRWLLTIRENSEFSLKSLWLLVLVTSFVNCEEKRLKYSSYLHWHILFLSSKFIQISSVLSYFWIPYQYFQILVFTVTLGYLFLHIHSKGMGRNCCLLLRVNWVEVFSKSSLFFF